MLGAASIWQVKRRVLVLAGFKQAAQFSKNAADSIAMPGQHAFAEIPDTRAAPVVESKWPTKARESRTVRFIRGTLGWQQLECSRLVTTLVSG